MEKPKYPLLSERMGDGETLEELVDKVRKIIESTSNNENIAGRTKGKSLVS